MLYRLLMHQSSVHETLHALLAPGSRAVLACATAFLLCLALCPFAIAWLKRLKVRERTEKTPIEDADLRRRIESKSGTPTMGGLVLVGSVLLACVLWCDPASYSVRVVILSVVALGLLGVADDVLKLRGEGHRDRGLKIRHKLAYQAVVGAAIGLLLWGRVGSLSAAGALPSMARLLSGAGAWATPLFVAWAVVVVWAMSNGTNVTDGLDGMLAGLTPLTAVVLGGACWAAGSPTLAARLGIAHAPGAGELTVFCAALSGACLGFLWYNRYPARVFMGDTGALAIGGGLATAALAAQMVPLLALAGLVFVVEIGSSFLQIAWFKTWGRRILPVAPLHHIFQKQGLAEPRIVHGFYLWGALAALLGLNLMCL